MTLIQIALRNLKRRKSKGAFMLAGLVLASASVVAIFSIISAMQNEISEQLADVGGNIVITADSGELTFHYGGITIPELVFDAVILTETDLDIVFTIPGRDTIIAAAPKLVGTAPAGDRVIFLAGVDLPAEFAVKPWLRFTGSGKESSGAAPEAAQGKQDGVMEMDYETLILERMEDVPVLAGNEVVPGAALAGELGLMAGDTLSLAGKDYNIVSVLEETGFSEDNQLFMALGEAQRLLGRHGELTMIELTADLSRIDETVLITQLGEELPHASVTGVRQAVMGRSELLNTLGRFGIFAGGLIVAAGLLTVSLTMLSSVKERTREIGIFRAIGLRSKHIFAIIIAEALLVGIIGGLAGYHVGLVAARYATPLLTGSAFSGTWGIFTLLAVIAATAFSGSLAGLIPAVKAAQLDPAEALRFN